MTINLFTPLPELVVLTGFSQRIDNNNPPNLSILPKGKLDSRPLLSVELGSGEGTGRERRERRIRDFRKLQQSGRIDLGYEVREEAEGSHLLSVRKSTFHFNPETVVCVRNYFVHDGLGAGVGLTYLATSDNNNKGARLYQGYGFNFMGSPQEGFQISHGHDIIENGTWKNFFRNYCSNTKSDDFDVDESKLIRLLQEKRLGIE